MHEQAIMDEILLKLETENCLVHTISRLREIFLLL